MIRPDAPTSSAITPMLLILASMATPDMLMIVVRTTITMARMIAFSAKSLLYRLQRVRGGSDDLEVGRDLGQDHLPCQRHRRHGDDLGAQVHPARVPRPGLRRELLGPLVDRACQRVVGRELGELEGDHELAEHDERATPRRRRGRRRRIRVLPSGTCRSGSRCSCNRLRTTRSSPTCGGAPAGTRTGPGGGCPSAWVLACPPLLCGVWWSRPAKSSPTFAVKSIRSAGFAGEWACEPLLLDRDLGVDHAQVDALAPAHDPRDHVDHERHDVEGEHVQLES